MNWSYPQRSLIRHSNPMPQDWDRLRWDREMLEASKRRLASLKKNSMANEQDIEFEKVVLNSTQRMIKEYEQGD